MAIGWRGVSGLVAAALLLTLLNGVKPLHVDDAVFHRFAAQVAAHPLDPYGFEIFSHPAMHELVLPVVPYWWSLAIRLFGDRPFWWKAWLFPFCLLLVLALHALLRRFATGFETPLVWMTIVSPLFLPSVNLMLDIPALALSLTAVAVFIAAIECDSRLPAVASPFMRANAGLLAVTAGVIAGLAMQTKYTALVVPVVTLLYAALVRKVTWGLLATSVAVLVFVSWEWLMTLVYGESHFLYHFRLLGGLSPPYRRMLHLALPLVAILGGVGPAVALFSVGALGARRRAVAVGIALVLLGYAALAVVPDHDAVFIVDRTGKARLTLNNLVFGALGAGVCATFVAVVRRVWPNRLRDQPIAWFLILWCGVELSAYFLLSPFPAARRVFGLVVASTLLAGHVASRTGSDWKRAPFVREALGVSVLLGSLFYAVDLLDARSGQEAIERAATLIRQRDGGSTAWYAGCCGFHFYGERAGMTPLVPHRSLLRKGDWIVVPDQRLLYAKVCLPPDCTALAATIRLDDDVPLTMMSAYYAGPTPMRHLDGPRLSAELYRVEMDFVACPPA